MELRDLEAYGEPGTLVYLADCAEQMHHVPAASVDAVFADLPYWLSNGGVTVTCGRLVCADKGSRDRLLGLGENHRLDLQSRSVSQCILRSEAALWVSSEMLGTTTKDL